jgi:hypothetical protein
MIVTVQNLIPSEIPAWCDLFNHPNFYNLHKTNSCFYLSFFLDEKLIGLCNFTEVEKGVFRSPYRGTYGNISFKEELDLQIKYNCVDELLNFFKVINAKKIEIVSEPFAHSLHNSSSLFNIYIAKSFTISNQEINHTLIVDERPLIEKMMRNNKKRLNKCERENFVFEQVFTTAEIEKVYQTIKENREGKGYKVSMSLEQILDMYKVFPEEMYFFKATQSDNCAAASVCIKLNNNVLYVFYWGDKLGFEQYSPVAYLANGIYNFAQIHNFKLIDAGTSSLHGEPNFGVATFKENLGFTISPKLTYSKEI